MPYLDLSAFCATMPVTIMAKNYANCPLKKRPIIFDDIPGKCHVKNFVLKKVHFF